MVTKRENNQSVAVVWRRKRLVDVPGVRGDTCREESSLPRLQSAGIKNWLQPFMRSLNLRVPIELPATVRRGRTDVCVESAEVGIPVICLSYGQI